MIIAGYLLQTTLFKAISLAGIVPNILIILTSAFGFMRGKNEGMIIGFTAGLMVDIFFGSMLGFYALVYMFIGFVNGKFNRLFYSEDFILPGSLFLSSNICYGLVYYILIFLLRGRFQFTYYLMNIILPESIYTLVCAIAFYPLLLICVNALKKSEQRRP